MKRVIVAIFFIVMAVIMAATQFSEKQSPLYEPTYEAREKLERSTVVDQDKLVDEITLLVNSADIQTDYYVKFVFFDLLNGEQVYGVNLSMLTAERMSLEEHRSKEFDELLQRILDNLWLDERFGPVDGGELRKVSVSWEDARPFGKMSRFVVYDDNADGSWDIGAYSVGNGSLNASFIPSGEGEETRQKLVIYEGQTTRLAGRVEAGDPFPKIQRILEG